jgi:hypothetical protein
MGISSPDPTRSLVLGLEGETALPSLETQTLVHVLTG